MDAPCILQGRTIRPEDVLANQSIGWNAAQRERHLQQITTNTRFLILPWVQVPHLASHVLSRVLHQLRADWQRKYGRALDLVETSVDTTGTASPQRPLGAQQSQQQ
jgi:hypothetical protein